MPPLVLRGFLQGHGRRLASMQCEQRSHRCTENRDGHKSKGGKRKEKRKRERGGGGGDWGRRLHTLFIEALAEVIEHAEAPYQSQQRGKEIKAACARRIVKSGAFEAHLITRVPESIGSVRPQRRHRREKKRPKHRGSVAVRLQIECGRHVSVHGAFCREGMREGHRHTRHVYRKGLCDSRTSIPNTAEGALT